MEHKVRLLKERLRLKERMKEIEKELISLGVDLNAVKGSKLNNALTPRQRQVYEFMLSYQEKNGQPPTYREIREGVGMNGDNDVRVSLKYLSRKGVVEVNNMATSRKCTAIRK